MSRWRVITLVLVLLALVLWVALFSLNLRPELVREFPHGILPAPNVLRTEQPLAGLPPWVASLELFITLFLAGVANLYLFPRRVRSMADLLSSGWKRLIPLALLGLGCGLLLAVFAVGAALARITFLFTILALFALLFLAVWGFLAVAYVVGGQLLRKAGWARSSPVLGVGLGLLLLLPLARIPFVGAIFTLFYIGLGFGLVVATHFGSNEAWSLNPLLEEDK